MSHRSRMHSIMSLAVIFFFSLSSLSAEVPDWVSVRPHTEGYIYGVGQSNHPERAGQIAVTEATVEISSQIMQTIANIREDDTEQEIVTIDEEQTVRLQQRFSSRTRSETGASALPGAEIVAQEQHGDTSYALVRLDRKNFIASTKTRTESIDSRLVRLQEAPQPITGAYIAQLRRVVDLAQQREELYWLLIALGERELLESPLPMHEFESRLGNLIRGNSIRLQGHARAPGTRDAVLDVIDILNLVEHEDAVFELRLRERARTEVQGNWHRAHITGAVTVLDADTQAIIGSLEHTASDASTANEETAVSRARAKFIEEMGAKLEQRLLLMLAGEGRRQ